MKRCTYCGREENDDTTNCSQCGKAAFTSIASNAPTTESERVPKGKGKLEFVPLLTEDAHNDLVTLLRCRTLLDADLIALRLKSAGIRAFIPDEFLMQSISWNVNTFGFVRVQVPPADYQAAKDFLLATESQRPSTP